MAGSTCLSDSDPQNNRRSNRLNLRGLSAVISVWNNGPRGQVIVQRPQLGYFRRSGAAEASNALSSGVHWLSANILGACIIYPFGMTISRHRFSKLRLAHRLPEAILVFVVLMATTLLGFRFSAYPLQFLVLAAALILLW